jgi:choline dehydrogenase
MRFSGALVAIAILLAFLLQPVLGSVFVLDDTGIPISNATYDYVVVGCGIAGLTVSNRLSENASVSVLCLEAGALDKYEPMIQYPFFIGGQPPLFYEWGMDTVPQTQLDAKPRPIPCGKGVGGGSIINGMVWNRGGQADFDAWEELGNPGWNWQDLLPYFRKSETFTPQVYAGQNGSDAGQIDSYDPLLHGFDGPPQVSYPQYLWPQSWAWFEALEDLGVPKATDPNDGVSAGGYFLPTNIHPTNQTRSDARRTYLDPVADRPNLDIATKALVTRIIFSQISPSMQAAYLATARSDPVRRQTASSGPQAPRPRALGVEIGFGTDLPRQAVFARREIILATGALHTPQILELSGIGDGVSLRRLGIDLIQDLPGVGNHLQDHALIHLSYEYQNPNMTSTNTIAHNKTLWAEAEAEYMASKTGPLTAWPSTAVGFPSMHQITNASYAAYVVALASLDNAASYLPDDTPPTVMAGYSAQLPYILRALNSSNVPSHEILNDNSGHLDLALLRPLSRGNVHISTASDPYAQPLVNPNWLAHPLDLVIMQRALDFNQRLLSTPSLSAFEPSLPFDTATADTAAILRSGIGTEYHYSGTAAMLPRELGGVVDPSLRVYGTEGLRVVDSSVFPLIPGSHLQAAVYAVAEKAADIIKGGNVPTRAAMLKDQLDGLRPKDPSSLYFGGEGKEDTEPLLRDRGSRKV